MKSDPITLHARYMILPIRQDAPRTRICFYENDILLWDFDAPIDTASPDRYTYMDILHLVGKTVTITSESNIEPHFDFCREIPPEAGKNQPYRPLVHFTARIGWTNDPNGLVYVNGLYHMFFQHNPADSQWGNMTWGHAISKDLIHWEQLDAALIPDELGTMFSGSGIVDHRNVSGLGTHDNPPVLFYYTAAGGCSLLSAGKPASQCLAYSTDGGMTLQKYAGNPVIPHIIGGNRDPKVIWCEELNCYLLALYMDGNDYAIFTSEDLLAFHELQRFPLSEDAECPDIYPLPVENEPGVCKWIFSGASDRYMIGDFSTGRFLPIQDTYPYAFGRDKFSYAAQTFSHTEARRIKIAWNRFHAPNACFNSQMGIPTEVSLSRVGDVYRLRTNPCREFHTLHDIHTEHAVTGSSFCLPLTEKAYDLTLSIERACPDLQLRFLGYTFVIQPSANMLSFGRDTMPLSYSDEPIRIRIIADVLGCELFADRGLIYAAYNGPSDYTLDTLSLEPLDSNAAMQAALSMCTLKSIH